MIISVSDKVENTVGKGEKLLPFPLSHNVLRSLLFSGLFTCYCTVPCFKDHLEKILGKTIKCWSPAFSSLPTMF